jgi:hypothetical protein
MTNEGGSAATTRDGVLEIPNPRQQIPNKLQSPNTEFLFGDG